MIRVPRSTLWLRRNDPMSDEWADAVNEFGDAVAAACSRANDRGVTDAELVRELRRIADELEAET